MSESSTGSTIAPLLAGYTGAGGELVEERFRSLLDAVWRDGRNTDLAPAAVADLVAALPTAPEDRVGRLVVLLGLLAEVEYPDGGAVTDAVRAGLPVYLDLLRRCVNGEPLTLALVYLLGHLRHDRDLILDAVTELGLDQDDQSRLERALAPLDLDDVVLGRVWPSPWEWALSDGEREFDRSWISALSAEQITATWHGETRTVLAYCGAKAYWAVCNGKPTVVTDASRHRAATGATPTELTAAEIGTHTAGLRCPTCRTPLDFADTVHCARCARDFPTRHGILDLLGGAGEDGDDVLRNAAAMQGIGAYYEAVLRPAFLRVMGSNWDGAVTPSDEDAYLADRLAGVDGPVLDLAAGAGRWTEVVADTVGRQRLVGLDVNAPMLAGMRGRLPDVPAVLASALDLPFADATLGAVNCWNALQAMPDAGAAVREVGRCLRPGGTFVALTFRWADDPVYRYFQGAHRMPGSPDGIVLPTLAEVTGWLADAGLDAREVSGPGTFVFVTAQRRK